MQKRNQPYLEVLSVLLRIVYAIVRLTPCCYVYIVAVVVAKAVLNYLKSVRFPVSEVY